MKNNEATTEKSVFQTLNSINVNEHTELKDKLTYLSWPWAWAEVKKRFPSVSYTIYRDEQKRPYVEDPDFGIICYTSVTIEGTTYDMWLPVMDGSNKAMKRKPYTYQVYNRYEKRYEEKTVQAATMFDINKTIMRCLVKNLAMFGLGLYIYAGEDLPEQQEPEQNPEQNPEPSIDDQWEKEAVITAIKECVTMDDMIRIWNQNKQKYGQDKDVRSAFAENRKTIEGALK